MESTHTRKSSFIFQESSGGRFDTSRKCETLSHPYQYLFFFIRTSSFVFRTS